MVAPHVLEVESVIAAKLPSVPAAQAGKVEKACGVRLILPGVIFISGVKDMPRAGVLFVVKVPFCPTSQENFSCGMAKVANASNARTICIIGAHSS
jgi:hypothetical protein